MLCEYGCDQEAKFILNNGKHCCESSPNKCPSVRSKNSEALKKLHHEGRLRSFTDEDRKKVNENQIQKAIKEGFVENSIMCNSFIKKYLISHFKVEEKCDTCKITNWNGDKLSFELDHINGISNDNRLENLRLLCPNCHSQTKNFRGRNINNGKEKVSEERFVEVLQRSKNIRRALLRLKLAPKGANYEKANHLIRKYNIKMEKNLSA